MAEGVTWHLLAAVATSITGVLLVAAAFSQDNPAPIPAILGSGALMLAHFRERRAER